MLKIKNELVKLISWGLLRSIQPTNSELILVNLGTPAAPTPAAVRRYLGEFSSELSNRFYCG